MDFSDPARLAAMIAYAAGGLGILFVLYKFKMRNDLRLWVQQLRTDAARAATDEPYRKEALAEADATLAGMGEIDDIRTITRKHELYLHASPRFMLILAFAGLVVLFLGLFQPLQEGESNWMIIVGPVFLLGVGILYLTTRTNRRQYRYVQWLNRKYLLEKAVQNFDATIPLMEKILVYYPSVPELWMELSDQYATSGQLEKALDTIQRAEKISPDAADLVMIELSFLIRMNSLKEAENVLKKLEDFKLQATDPRLHLYRAAIRTKENNQKSAKAEVEKALELDGPFCIQFAEVDETLSVIKELLVKKEIAGE